MFAFFWRSTYFNHKDSPHRCWTVTMLDIYPGKPLPMVMGKQQWWSALEDSSSWSLKSHELFSGSQAADFSQTEFSEPRKKIYFSAYWLESQFLNNSFPSARVTSRSRTTTSIPKKSFQGMKSRALQTLLSRQEVLLGRCANRSKRFSKYLSFKTTE